MKRTPLLALVALALVSCGDDTKPAATTPSTGAPSVTIVIRVPATKLPAGVDDFARRAEQFIEGPIVQAKIGFALKDAECAEPAGVDAGTEFECLARSADDESLYRFTVEITSAKAFLVTDVEPVAAS